MIIREEDEYDAALADAASLMDAELDTPQGTRLDEVVQAIESYEAIRWPISPKPPANQAR